MCGVIGYIGPKPCVDIVFNGLKRLEYRGYDSAGIAVLDQGRIALAKAKGKLRQLEPLLETLPKQATVGIGHTRWATHGPPSTKNAHPHVGETLGIVHNGIIENFQDLRAGLEAAGAVLKTDTDTEVILHVLTEELKTAASTKDAILKLSKILKGAYSLGIIIPAEPDALYLVKQGSPLVIGLGKDENLFASDAAALVEHTKKAIFLEDGEFARITAHDCTIWNFSGAVVKRDATELEWSQDSVGRLGFSHYMLKEIFEQPNAIGSTIARLVDRESGAVNTQQMALHRLNIDGIRNIHIIACGTAYISGCVAKYALESLARLPVNVELASEFRYRNPCIDKSSLLIAVSQSGETMDTLESTKYAKKQGCQVYAICNVQHSSIAREADATLYMEAGPEIGVASTKAFTSMVLCQYILALALAEARRIDVGAEKSAALKVMAALPVHIEKILAQSAKIADLANKYYQSRNFLYIGRGEQFPIAMEGALKLKEISYIHAEAYAAGELKHGPIALVDRNMPLFAIAPMDKYYNKTLSNVEQVRARNGRIIGLGSEDDEKLRKIADDFISCPQVAVPVLQSILTTIPLQLFAYYMALRRGTDVDQPRNLAKSVTVE